jgi:hypothetical protein
MTMRAFLMGLLFVLGWEALAVGLAPTDRVTDRRGVQRTTDGGVGMPPPK